MSPPVAVPEWAAFTGRLPEPLHRDALDLARARSLSFNELLIEGIESYVASQLERLLIATAVDRMRAAREVTSPAGGPRRRARGGRAKAARRRKPI
ncbi:MAG: hypothetical protein ACHQ6T_12175 [Myxococcota bacterium]